MAGGVDHGGEVVTLGEKIAHVATHPLSEPVMVLRDAILSGVQDAHTIRTGLGLSRVDVAREAIQSVTYGAELWRWLIGTREHRVYPPEQRQQVPCRGLLRVVDGAMMVFATGARVYWDQLLGAAPQWTIGDLQRSGYRTNEPGGIIEVSYQWGDPGQWKCTHATWDGQNCTHDPRWSHSRRVPNDTIGGRLRARYGGHWQAGVEAASSVNSDRVWVNRWSARGEFCGTTVVDISRLTLARLVTPTMAREMMWSAACECAELLITDQPEDRFPIAQFDRVAPPPVSYGDVSNALYTMESGKYVRLPRQGDRARAFLHPATYREVTHSFLANTEYHPNPWNPGNERSPVGDLTVGGVLLQPLSTIEPGWMHLITERYE